MKGLSKVVESFSPINPGPLAKDIANTFRSATYTENIAEGQITLYRSYGGTAGELGSFWTRTKPTGPMQSTIDNALSPAWGNTAEKVSSMTIPKGTRFYEGVVAPQGNLVGGGNQIYIPEEFLNPDWLNK
jgi:filamentous hemagglutinin